MGRRLRAADWGRGGLGFGRELSGGGIEIWGRAGAIWWERAAARAGSVRHRSWIWDLGEQKGLGFLTCGPGQFLRGSWAREKWAHELGGAHLFLAADWLTVYMILATNR